MDQTGTSRGRGRFAGQEGLCNQQQRQQQAQIDQERTQLSRNQAGPGQNLPCSAPHAVIPTTAAVQSMEVRSRGPALTTSSLRTEVDPIGCHQISEGKMSSSKCDVSDNFFEVRKNQNCQEERLIYGCESLDFTNRFSKEQSCSETAKKPKYDLDPTKFEVDVQHKPNEFKSKGHLLMQRMGYKCGTGLGKNAQGRVEPVELSQQRGKRGLGLSIPGLDPAEVQWNEETEVVKSKEEILWLNGCHLDTLDKSTLSQWKKTGPRDTKIENMTEFCNEVLLKKILDGKSVFDQLSEGELLRARSRSNPFETLKNAIFLNRAALKMANMDAAYDFMFTNPKYPDGEPMVGPKDLLYFADVCAGPGGFSEYVLWKKQWKAKGVGFTLKGDNDFNLSKFYAGCPLTFEPYYGKHDDGDIYNPENIKSLTEFIMDVTDNAGVHFMMADGGFSVDGQENIQEILSKQLYLCQCIVALSIVRTHGHFVCKLFDIFTPFSAGIVYLMYRSFQSISIFKPNTSRPANSERYIVCKHKRRDCYDIRDYLFQLNQELFKMGPNSKTDITGIVSLSQLKEDKSFYDYLVTSNQYLGERQVVNLLKIKSYCQDQNLFETRQQKMREECLKLWKVPDQPRFTDRLTPDQVANKIIPNHKGSLSFNIHPLVSDMFERAFKGIYDWQCFALSSTEPKFYLGVSGGIVFHWNSKRLTWDRMTDCNVKLNPGTLIYGEVTQEIQRDLKGQKRINVLQVIDGISIGYQDISQLPFRERLSQLQLYETAIKKKTECNNLRVKVHFPMEEAETIFQKLKVRNSHVHQTQFLIEEKDYWFEPKAILFVNTTKPPWMRNVSKSNRKAAYFFHTFDRISFFEKECGNKDVHENTLESLRKSLLWKWEPGVGLKKEAPCEGIVHKDHLTDLINKFIKK